jgi:hypothetical protein
MPQNDHSASNGSTTGVDLETLVVRKETSCELCGNNTEKAQSLAAQSASGKDYIGSKFEYPGCPGSS